MWYVFGVVGALTKKFLSFSVISAYYMFIYVYINLYDVFVILLNSWVKYAI